MIAALLFGVVIGAAGMLAATLAADLVRPGSARALIVSALRRLADELATPTGERPAATDRPAEPQPALSAARSSRAPTAATQPAEAAPAFDAPF